MQTPRSPKGDVPMQLNETFGYTLLVLLFTWPAYILPIVIGPILLAKLRGDRIARLAGLFILKPLLATPLWAMLLSLKESSYMTEQTFNMLSMLPAILLTLLIVWRHRTAFTTDRNLALLLLFADALRWLNTLAWQLWDGEMGAFYVLGLALPNAYAIMALIILWLRTRSQSRLEQTALGRLAS
jgi:hypothetical protein